jgi:glycosyltransferase involved in cell wall biosynthesis
MRVAFNGWFWDQPHTGSGQYLRALLAHLPPDIEPILVLPRPTASESDDAITADHGSRITYYVLRASTSNLGKVYFEQFSFPRACRAVRADLAHVPHWAPPLRSPVPIVVTVHDLIPLRLPEYSPGLLARLYTALVSAATSGAARVIADSAASRDDVVERLHVPPERVRAVLLAAGPEYRPGKTFFPEPALQKKYGLPDGYVLYLGGFDPRKNVSGLLAAWTWATNAIGEAYPLVVAGELPRPGGLFEDVRAQAAELNVDDSVRFIGPVEEADKPALYRGAACFVYPSRFEGFGLPVLEAMACGTPVVTTAAGSLAEVAGDAAYLVPPDDARAIGAGIIATVVQESLADELRTKGLAQAAKFSWEKTASETAEVYREVMELKGRRAG